MRIYAAIDEQMMNIRSIELRQRVRYNFSVAIFRVSLKAEQTTFGRQGQFAGLFQRRLRIGRRQMPGVNLSEFGEPASARRVAAGFWIAKRLKVNVAKPGGLQCLGQGSLGESAFSRER